MAKKWHLANKTWNRTKIKRWCAVGLSSCDISGQLKATFVASIQGSSTLISRRSRYSTCRRRVYELCNLLFDSLSPKSTTSHSICDYRLSQRLYNAQCVLRISYLVRAWNLGLSRVGIKTWQVSSLLVLSTPGYRYPSDEFRGRPFHCIWIWFPNFQGIYPLLPLSVLAQCSSHSCL